MPNEDGSLLTNETLADDAGETSEASDDGKAGDAKGDEGKAEETGKAGDAKGDEGKASDDADDGDGSGDKSPSEKEAEAKAEKEATEKAEKEAKEKSEEAEKADKEAKDKAEKDKGDEDTLTGAPEAYDEFVMPEGVELVDDRLKEFQDIAKEMDLSQKGAQTLIDKHIQTLNEVAEAQNEAWAETRAEWREATKSDKEFGGQKLKANLVYAKAALNAFGNAEFVSLVDDYGLGDNPEVVRFLIKAGKAVSEDGLMPSGGRGGSGGSNKSQAERLFPSHADK